MRSNPKSGLAVKPPQASTVVRQYLRVCESVDTPLSLSCFLLAKYGEWDQLVTKKLSPLSYLDAASFRLDYLAVSILSKADFLPTSFDRSKTAIEAFWAAEKQCEETNLRLGLYGSGMLMPSSLSVHGALHRAREFLLSLLGDEPRHALKAFRVGPVARAEPAQKGLQFRFGPGVTSVTKKYIAAAEKYTRRVDVTPSLYPFWRDVAGPRWAHHINSVSLLASNTVSFVPKNAKTFRAIAVEPHLNGYAQLGVAGLLRRRLKAYGIDLATQADRNRLLAKAASTGRWLTDLATIDLSSASDTVSREIIWLLFPEKWAELLDTIRSPYGTLNGVEFEYAKFSSMGNGCTFEVETILFLALARACGSRREFTDVFGDDMIVETSTVPLLREVLSFCGFTVNEGKTFTTGPFRESCGVDTFHGADVRPFFWKSLDVPLWFKMCNDIRTFARHLKDDKRRSSAFRATWFDTTKCLPRPLDCRVPSGYDSFGVVDREPAAVKRLQNDTWDGYSFTGVAFSSIKTDIWSNEQALLYCLDGGTYEGEGKTSFRGVGVWRKVRLSAFGTWPNDGCWG